MNEIIKAMEERRSIRKFKPDMPAKEDLEPVSYTHLIWNMIRCH